MKKKSRPLHHITRVDYEKKHQHGWWVRLQRDHQQMQKFFSDAAHRSKAAALRAAKRYREELLAIHPKPESGNMFNRLNRRNRSGQPGVHRTITRKDGRIYTVWQAGWVLPNGKQIKKKFAYSLEGRTEREAKDLAVKAREEGLAMIERMRAEQRKERASATG